MGSFFAPETDMVFGDGVGASLVLVAAESPQEGESFLQQLQTIWRIKLTGRIPALEKGVLQFLGRTIYRERDGESTLNLGVSEAYMTGVIDSWHEKLKPNETPPKLEEIYKDREKQGEDTPLTADGEARYRRVLGQLAWAALSRADLCFSVSYLARFQSKPSGAAEACLRALLRWLLTRLHRVQIMPSPEGSPSVGPRSVVGVCDASWNVASVSGGVLMFEGCCIKVFSRKQECPALSSAEAELCAMTENSKELVSLGMLLESILDGIPLTILGTPQCTTGTYQLVLRNDATAAISISSMEGLLRRVRHIELRAKYTVKVPLSQPCFDHFFGPCFRGHDEAGLLAFSMSLFSDVGPLEAIAENKTEQKSAAKRRQRLLKAPLKPPSYDARFPTARSV